MSTFDNRVILDQKLKIIVAGFFQKFLERKVYFRTIGVEGELADIHEHIRFKRDMTTEFMRYRPDGFVCWNKDIPKESLLIELKTAMTGWKLDAARPLQMMRRTVPDLRKEEVANIELGSFDNLIRLRSVGVSTVIWLYIPYHLTSRWLAIEPDSRLNLLSYQTGEMKQTAGSGTPIANVFVRIDGKSVFDLADWVSTRFGLEADSVRRYFAESEREITRSRT